MVAGRPSQGQRAAGRERERALEQSMVHGFGKAANWGHRRRASTSAEPALPLLDDLLRLTRRTEVSP